jgi:hypothetical protein
VISGLRCHGADKWQMCSSFKDQCCRVFCLFANLACFDFMENPNAVERGSIQDGSCVDHASDYI